MAVWDGAAAGAHGQSLRAERVPCGIHDGAAGAVDRLSAADGTVFCGDSARPRGDSEALPGYRGGWAGGSEADAGDDQRLQQSGAGDGRAVSVAALRELSLSGD